MSTDEYLTRHVPWDRQSIIQSSAWSVEDPKPRETVEKIARQIGNQSTAAAAFNISSTRLALHDRRESQPSIDREIPQISVVVPELPALTTERLPPVTNPAGDWFSAKDIEEALQALLSPPAEHDDGPRKVEFSLHWELRRCIRDNLSGKSLGPVLTISGDETHSWAASCEEYVSHVWGDAGRELLKGLSSALEGEFPSYHHGKRPGQHLHSSVHSFLCFVPSLSASFPLLFNFCPELTRELARFEPWSGNLRTCASCERSLESIRRGHGGSAKEPRGHSPVLSMDCRNFPVTSRVARVCHVGCVVYGGILLFIRRQAWELAGFGRTKARHLLDSTLPQNRDRLWISGTKNTGTPRASNSSRDHDRLGRHRTRCHLARGRRQ